MLYQLLKPFLFNIDPETAHYLAMEMAHWGTWASRWLHQVYRVSDIRLQQSLFGMDFGNPVGLAAGFDKNANLLGFWPALGFGFVEVGSVTAQPSEGNPKPRAFRLPDDEALINRMGLNNDGAKAVAQRLAGIGQSGIPLGINIAKTHDPAILGTAAIADFTTSFRLLAPFAGYIALNISCPNTAEGKTFEEPDALNQLLSAIFSERSTLGLEVPVLVKLSPPPSENPHDFAYVKDLLSVMESFPIAGLIATNTASDRKGLTSNVKVVQEIGRGGLSGKPLRNRSTALIRALYHETQGKLPIIGLGGVDSPLAAFEKIKAGATLVQVYTGMVYQGPGLVCDINKGLLHLLEKNGFGHIREAIVPKYSVHTGCISRMPIDIRYT